MSVVLSDDNKWQHTFTDLPKYENDILIKYSIEEVSVKDYESSITGDVETGFIVTNTKKPPTPTPTPTPSTPPINPPTYKAPPTATDNNIMLFVVLTLLAGVGLYLVNKKRK